MHPCPSVPLYHDPVVCAVYGLPPVYSRLHRLREQDGTFHLVAMTESQCNAWCAQHPQWTCLERDLDQ